LWLGPDGGDGVRVGVNGIINHALVAGSGKALWASAPKASYAPNRGPFPIRTYKVIVPLFFTPTP